MQYKGSKLEKTVAKLSGAIIASEYFLCYNNYDKLHFAGTRTFRWLPIKESYFGDAPEIFTAIMISGFVADKIEEYGNKHKNKLIEKIGTHFPALTATTLAAYYALGESIFPNLLPGTADTKDIPAVIITAVAGTFIANYLRPKQQEIKDKMNSAIKKMMASSY